MLSPKAKYRVTCAIDEVDKAIIAMDTAKKWLNQTDMSLTPEMHYAQGDAHGLMSAMQLLRAHMEDML